MPPAVRQPEGHLSNQRILCANNCLRGVQLGLCRRQPLSYDSDHSPCCSDKEKAAPGRIVREEERNFGPSAEVSVLVGVVVDVVVIVEVAVVAIVLLVIVAVAVGSVVVAVVSVSERS